MPAAFENHLILPCPIRGSAGSASEELSAITASGFLPRSFSNSSGRIGTVSRTRRQMSVSD